MRPSIKFPYCNWFRVPGGKKIRRFRTNERTNERSGGRGAAAAAAAAAAAPQGCMDGGENIFEVFLRFWSFSQFGHFFVIFGEILDFFHLYPPP